jgi:cell wall-associated NlpC family hydrolase
MKKLITIPLILFSLLGFSQKQIDSTTEKTILPNYISGISNDITSKLDTFVNKWKGKPYVYGGLSLKGIDCSGFIQTLYKDVFDILIPRTAYSQYKSSTKISKDEMGVGDLLFFMSRSSPSGWHVAVYLGNNVIMHAANRKRGVVVDQLTSIIRKNIYSVGHFKIGL